MRPSAAIRTVASAFCASSGGRYWTLSAPGPAESDGRSSPRSTSADGTSASTGLPNASSTRATIAVTLRWSAITRSAASSIASSAGAPAASATSNRCGAPPWRSRSSSESDRAGRRSGTATETASFPGADGASSVTFPSEVAATKSPEVGLPAASRTESSSRSGPEPAIQGAGRELKASVAGGPGTRRAVALARRVGSFASHAERPTGPGAPAGTVHEATQAPGPSRTGAESCPWAAPKRTWAPGSGAPSAVTANATTERTLGRSARTVSPTSARWTWGTFGRPRSIGLVPW